MVKVRAVAVGYQMVVGQRGYPRQISIINLLTRFLDYPVLELSNNLAENAIRPVALGRNWIHVGSKEAGPRVAAIISVVATCRRLKIPVRDYLGSVLPGLGDFPISRIVELTPAAWAKRNKQPTLSTL
jgi:transposase